jgi:nitroreductase
MTGIIMDLDITEQKNMFLDQILAERRSYRVFRPEIPPEDEIRRILNAGLLAPYAAAAVGGSKDYFRRFFVIRNGSESMQTAKRLVMEAANRMADDLEQEMNRNAKIRSMAVSFVQRLAMMKSRKVVPGVGTAPYYIVVAERKGFPPVEQQSLAHCLENMWLKATALDLGFQLVSITAQLSADPNFCNLLGIVPGEWELMGCAIGYPADELGPSIRPPVDDVSRWLE